GLTYTLGSQSLSHGSLVTITSSNRAFGASPSAGVTSAKFTYSCNAGVLSLDSTTNNAGSCNSGGYTFNGNYSSPSCTANCPSGMTLYGTSCYSGLRGKNFFNNAYYDCLNNFGTKFMGAPPGNTSYPLWSVFAANQVNYRTEVASRSCYPSTYPPGVNLTEDCGGASLNTIFSSFHSSNPPTPNVSYDKKAYYYCKKDI
ncbi:hypothetical protein H3C61_01420, partial [Candidatus Gracilibacteria bacterium]|nr:hypothetical protein [Candidatus Gracilibacteria bacterium]